MGLRMAIVGYGKMGRSIERLAPEHDCKVAQIVRSAENANAMALNRDSLSGIDVAIEFTTALVAQQNLRHLIEAGIPVVTGTTGWCAELPGHAHMLGAGRAGAAQSRSPPTSVPMSHR